MLWLSAVVVLVSTSGVNQIETYYIFSCPALLSTFLFISLDCHTSHVVPSASAIQQIHIIMSTATHPETINNVRLIVRIS